MDSQQHEVLEDAMCRVDSISVVTFTEVTKVTVMTQLALLHNSSINMADIETEGTDTGSSVVRACDTDVHCLDVNSV